MRRGPNGDIEAIDPTKEKGAGLRRCAAAAICVGKNQVYRTLADALAVARPGMTINITGGTYRETVAVRTRDLTIRGVAGLPHIDCTGLKPAFPGRNGVFERLVPDSDIRVSILWRSDGAAMVDPTGETKAEALSLDFDRRLRLQFHGSVITSDGGLLAYRELDDVLALTTSGGERLAEARTGKNRRHLLVGLLRQSVFGRLAGYEDVNDADRLCRDPAMRWVVGDRAITGKIFGWRGR